MIRGRLLFGDEGPQVIEASSMGVMRVEPVDGIVDLKIDDGRIVVFFQRLDIFFQRKIAAAADLVVGIGEMDKADLIFTEGVIVHLKIFSCNRHGDQVDADLEVW